MNKKDRKFIQDKIEVNKKLLRQITDRERQLEKEKEQLAEKKNALAGAIMALKELENI